MVETSLTATIAAVCVVGVLIGTIIIDALNARSKELHSQKYRWRRVINWLPVAVAYSGFYLGRYNVASINLPTVRNELGMTKAQIGIVVTAGMWSYAGTAPITGKLVNNLGAQVAVLVGAAGSGIANLCILLLPYVLPAGGGPITVGLALIFSVNVAVQGFGTASAMKLVASWYAPEERGLFSGLFNTWITFGYFMAMTLEPQIVEIRWPLVFAFPGAGLLCCAVLISLLVRSRPEDAGCEPVDVVLVGEASHGDYMPLPSPASERDRASSFSEADFMESIGASQVGEEEKVASAEIEQAACAPAPSLFREMLLNPMFPTYAIGNICISCVRDGFITWLLSFLVDSGAVKADASAWLISSTAILPPPPPNEAVGLAIFGGGALGGVALGAFSDRFFAGSRLEPLILFTAAQALTLWFLYANVSEPSSVGPWLVTGLIFLTCFFTMGNYALLCYGVPADMGERLAGFVTGILTCVQYFGSGIMGAFLGFLITDYGYWSWFLSVESSTLVMVAVLVRARLFIRKP